MTANDGIGVPDKLRLVPKLGEFGIMAILPPPLPGVVVDDKLSIDVILPVRVFKFGA